MLVYHVKQVEKLVKLQRVKSLVVWLKYLKYNNTAYHAFSTQSTLGNR